MNEFEKSKYTPCALHVFLLETKPLFEYGSTGVHPVILEFYFRFCFLPILVGHLVMIVGALSKIKKGARIGSQNLNSFFL